MKAKFVFEIEINDDDFENEEQKNLFIEADEFSRQEWLKYKAEELKEYAEIVTPIKYEL